MRAAAVEVAQPAGGELAPSAATNVCDLRGAGTTVDAYKIRLAHHVARTNLGNTFEGRLPQMLPASGPAG